MTMEYNVEKLKEIYKKGLLFSVQARMLKQDLTQNNRAFMKGMLKAKIKNVGKLPIGPICNPSKDAIIAVLNYTPNVYYYFVYLQLFQQVVLSLMRT